MKKDIWQMMEWFVKTFKPVAIFCLGATVGMLITYFA